MMNPAYCSVTIFTTGLPAASPRRVAEHPLVATVIPVWQEVNHLERCLASFIAQDWPADKHLIQVVDGGSSDGTRDIVKRLAAQSEAAGGPRVVLLDNPDRFVPHARNLSLAGMPSEVELVLEMIDARGWKARGRISFAGVAKPSAREGKQARYGIVWGALGALEAVYAEALAFAGSRVTFGKPIGSRQLVQAKLEHAPTVGPVAPLIGTPSLPRSTGLRAG